MALLAVSLQNVYQSLDAYLTAVLLFPDGAPIALKGHGVRRFVPPPVDPWVEAHYNFLGLDDTFMGRVGQGDGPQRFAVQRSGYLQLNLYQRARVFTTRYTTAFIRDVVYAQFPEGGLIDVLDYTGTLPDVAPEKQASVILDGITENVVDTGDQSGVIQHVLRVQTRYVENYSRA